MFLHLAEYVGIAAFSFSGTYIALKHRLDLLGVYIASFLTALGGGILRDLLIQRPPYALSHAAPALCALGVTTLLLWRAVRPHESILSKHLFVLIDAVGLVSFAISGALAGIERGYTLVGVTILAFLTAVGGGMLRDILVNRVPYVLHGGFYGIVAVGIGATAYLLSLIDGITPLTLAILFAAGVGLRMQAYARDWKLPHP
ncbi:trimeric intracellular cation channel family protein [Nitratifractor sp.]